MGGDKKVCQKRREHAFVVGTTGVTARMEAAGSSIGQWKRSAPLSGIWTVTEVTQKLCHLLFAARRPEEAPVTSTGTGTGPAWKMGVGWGGQQGCRRGRGGRDSGEAAVDV